MALLSRPIYIAAIIFLSSRFAFSQSIGAPSGYYDIPGGFDFPADNRVLERYRSQPNVPGQRLHVWNVFSGMTSPTPDGKFAIFETWFSEDETFAPVTILTTPRPTTHQFRLPNQFRTSPSKLITEARPNVEAGGDAALSFVLYNLAAYNHIRSNHLYQSSTLDGLLKRGRQILQFRKTERYHRSRLELLYSSLCGGRLQKTSFRRCRYGIPRTIQPSQQVTHGKHGRDTSVSIQLAHMFRQEKQPILSMTGRSSTARTSLGLVAFITSSLMPTKPRA